MRRLRECALAMIALSFLMVVTLAPIALVGELKKLKELEKEKRYIIETRVRGYKGRELLEEINEKLEKYYVNQKQLELDKLLNAALHGVEMYLHDHGYAYVPERITTQKDKEKMWQQFEKAFGTSAQLVANNKAIAKDSLVFAAAEAMVASLKSSHTSISRNVDLPAGYGLSGDETRALLNIGILIKKTPNNVLYVYGVLSGSLAAKAGVANFDELRLLNGELLGSDLRRLCVAMSKLSAVRLEVWRPAKKKCMEFVMGNKVKSLSNVKLVHWHEGYIVEIGVTEFNTKDDFAGVVEMQASIGDARGMVLDLRGNGGGELPEVEELLSVVLRSETPIFRSIDRYGKRRVHRTAFKLWNNIDIPLAVLVDELSASGAEIVAGVLQECGRAKVVGKCTRGAVEIGRRYSLGCSAKVNITIERFETMKGHVLEGVGVNPDRVVELTENDIREGRDTQLEVALEEVRKMME